ncbi:MAG: metallophosphoesterase [Saprospiraceae bacterium]|nr:metallophosphoesterase [Saprospiraceae bacterium]MCB9326487.1 metallophosphoesterase [Lewinellaceae bacterium]
MGVLIACAVVFFLDLYVYKGISTLTESLSKSGQTGVFFLFWTVRVALLLAFAYTITHFNEFRVNHPRAFIFWTSAFFVVTLPMLVFAAFHFANDLTNGVLWGVNKLANPGTDYSRRTFITQAGLGVGALLMGGFFYGVTKGKFAFRVMKNQVVSSRLPKAFDGLKIVQISDAHLGSFINNFEPVKKMVRMINDLEADYVVFTGDMVNSLSDEAEPWIDVFSGIKAKYGKFSIFGNHDYADYGNYTESEKIKSRNRLKEIHKEMGFRLLEDEHVELQRDGEKISLIGVHNWGAGFHQVGNLANAMQNVNPDHFKILLSHDPTHWEHQVLGKEDIHLTFSGHTHGMQMGIEIPSLGIKWSPVKLRYKRWAGLYTEGEQHLHVNRGLGVLAFPGRLGMAPEITLVELKSA